MIFPEYFIIPCRNHLHLIASETLETLENSDRLSQSQCLEPRDARPGTSSSTVPADSTAAAKFPFNPQEIEDHEASFLLAFSS